MDPFQLEKRAIRVLGARQNNLKNINVQFPARRLSVITGLSGSGKSSLAFDTIYAEGQRRYVESLSTYTRQFLEKMPKPDVESIENIPPALALEQRNPILNARSTVGTQTEITDYLRILFARAGETECLNCGSHVQKITPEAITQESLLWLPHRKAMIAAPLFTHTPEPSLSSKKKKKKKKKKKLGSGSAQLSAPRLETLMQVLREQGYRRLLYVSRKNTTPKIFDLEDFKDEIPAQISEKNLNAGKLWVVVDRIRLKDTEAASDPEVQSRIFDSIDQAVKIGKGRVELFDLDSPESRKFDCRFACLQCGLEHQTPEPNFFSFNSPLGACDHCSGFGYTLDIDEEKVVPDPSLPLRKGALDPLSKPSYLAWQKDLLRFAERLKISTTKPYAQLTARQKELLWNGSEQSDVFPGVLGFFDKLSLKKYKIHVRVFIRRYQSQTLCRHCKGTRLKPETLAVKIGNKNIADVHGLSIENAITWFKEVKIDPRKKKIAEDIFRQVNRRLEFLDKVGVNYLTLSRLAKTLSGGEFQRINLATQLGNGLCGTLYVLDEPSIGLHAADTNRLIQVLEDLRDQGNTVIVVEHDLEMMKAADHLVEIGPGSGIHGGNLIASGTAAALMKDQKSVTGAYLSGKKVLKRVTPLRPPPKKFIKLTGCRENNLKDITVEIPLERFVVVSGMSGSGKSTLVNQTIYRALNELFHSTQQKTQSEQSAGEYDHLYGANFLRDVVLLDQKPIGKNSRSNPATYLKAWDEIRRIYSNQVASLRGGYTPQYFSFNVEGGRCPTCKGEGEITLDMHFMAEVKIPCEECKGRRFKKDVLEVTYRGKNIFQILDSTIDEAYTLFRDNPFLARKFSILRSVGLGYLKLGQSGPTLSGGESQRLKIASVLNQRDSGKTLYIFDEPTTGLHLDDIQNLLEVLQDLVNDGNSILMIEHHLDVIAQADWLIDLGPGGGEKGGSIVASSTPEEITQSFHSATGESLRSHHTFKENNF
jgi:excinuclease ABC subunit A